MDCRNKWQLRYEKDRKTEQVLYVLGIAGRMTSKRESSIIEESALERMRSLKSHQGEVVEKSQSMVWLVCDAVRA